MITRRRTVQAALAAPVILSGAGYARRARAAGEVVVGTWGGDYGDLLAKYVDQPLLKSQGIQVTQDVGDAPTRKTKLLAERGSRRSSFDVCCLGDTDMFQVARLGLFETLTPKEVPNLAHVIPALVKPYAIPHIYSGQVVLYNPKHCTPAPTGYADMWDPKYANRVALADGNYGVITATAAVVGGGSMSDYGPSRAKLLEWKKMGVKIFPSNESLAASLKAEETWITPMWLARGYQWEKASVPIVSVVPKEGAIPVVFQAGVPKNARNKEAAYAYLNAMLEPAAQVGFAQRMGYGPTVDNAPLPPDLQAAIGFTPDQQKHFLQYDYSFAADQDAVVLDFWNKSFKG